MKVCVNTEKYRTHRRNYLSTGNTEEGVPGDMRPSTYKPRIFYLQPTLLIMLLKWKNAFVIGN